MVALLLEVGEVVDHHSEEEASLVDLVGFPAAVAPVDRGSQSKSEERRENSLTNVPETINQKRVTRK